MTESTSSAFFVAVAALSATLLLTTSAAIYSTAQTAGSRYGLRFWHIGGLRGGVFLVVCSATLITSLLEAAVALRPGLHSFLGVSLPFARLAVRPETALTFILAVVACLVLVFLTLMRVIGLATASSVGSMTIGAASRSAFLDYHWATEGLPMPPTPQDVARSMVASRLSLDPDLGQPLPVRDEGAERRRRERLAADYRARSERLMRGLGRGRIDNPLSPAVNSLHQLIENRNVAAYRHTWRLVVARIEEWAGVQPIGTPEWVGVEAVKLIESEWLWSEMEDLVRHALAEHFEPAAVITVEALNRAAERILASPRGFRAAPSRHLSSVGHMAIESGAGSVTEAVLDLYAGVARQGLASNTPDLFEQSCLGIGNLGEASAALPAKSRSIISANNQQAFAGPFDPALESAKRLKELAYEHGASALPQYPLFLVDALMLCFHAAVDASSAGRSEMALECIHGMSEVLATAIRRKDLEHVSYIGPQLEDMAEKLSDSRLTPSVIARAWDSLSYSVIDGIAFDVTSGSGGSVDPYSAVGPFLRIASGMPAEVTRKLGEVAWRTKLELGADVPRAVQEILKKEVGIAVD